MSLRTFVTSIGSGLIITLAFTACSDDGHSSRDATESDLREMVLGQDDVPEEMQQLPDEGASGRGFEPGDFGSIAGYATEFETAADEGQTGQRLCIGSGITLFSSDDEAAEALDGFLNTLRIGLGTVGDEEGSDELEQIDAPDIGADAIAGRFYSPTAMFCSFDSLPSEAVAVAFRRENTMGIVSVHVRDRGTAIAEAAELASRQIENIDSTLKGSAP